jgi:Family of unknown function (DUF6127)
MLQQPISARHQREDAQGYEDPSAHSEGITYIGPKYIEDSHMVEENLKGLLEQASESGARRALALLGLDDSHAAKDMGELRELLSAWRDAKRSARKAAIGWLVRMALA